MTEYGNVVFYLSSHGTDLSKPALPSWCTQEVLDEILNNTPGVPVGWGLDGGPWAEKPHWIVGPWVGVQYGSSGYAFHICSVGWYGTTEDRDGAA